MDRSYLYAYLVALVAAGWYYLHRSTRRATQAALTHATGRGVQVTNVRREGPVSKDRGRTWQLEEFACFRYALPLRSGGRSAWALLMRPGQNQPPLPAGWTFSAQQESMSPALMPLLGTIAAERQEEYLELEGESDAVVAYWEQWGGAEGAARICTYLEQVARA